MPAMTTTPAQRRATANSFKKREASGLKRSTFWLTPEARAKLEADKAATGKPKDQLVNEAILANRTAPPVQDKIAELEAHIARFRAILHEDGLYDPELAAMAGAPMTLLDAVTIGSRKFSPVQDTKAGPVADYESKQAERRSRERPKTLSATLPAGDPVKAATKAPARTGDGAPLRFPRAPIGSLVKSSHKPKR